MIPIAYYWWSFLMTPETWFLLVVMIPAALCVMLGYIVGSVVLEKARKRRVRRELRRYR